MVIDEGEQDKLHIRLTNHLTGEISDIEITNAEQAKNTLTELNASTSAIRKAQDSLRHYLDAFLGEDKEYKFADGKILRRVQRSTLAYRVESLRKYFEAIEDEDNRRVALETCLKVDTSTANQLIQEMMESGELPSDTLKKIRDEADVNATRPYVEVR